MTEDVWLACTEYDLLIEAIDSQNSPRKSRLFNVACCRRIWRLFRRESVREAILVGERFADGQASADELRTALRAIHSGRAVQPIFSPQEMAHHAAAFVALDYNPGLQSAGFAITAVAREVTQDRQASVRATESLAICSLVREFYGNPFRPVTPDPSWLTETVLALATGIYDDHAFDAMPILADALEDTGCDESQLLDHCRSGGPHYRGCWALDSLLGKK